MLCGIKSSEKGGKEMAEIAEVVGTIATETAVIFIFDDGTCEVFYAEDMEEQKPQVGE